MLAATPGSTGAAAIDTSRLRPGAAGFIEFRHGHSKYDYHYSIEQLTPDVVVQLWEHREEVGPYLRRFYTGITVAGKCVYARDASPHVRWQSVSAAPCGEVAH